MVVYTQKDDFDSLATEPFPSPPQEYDYLRRHAAKSFLARNQDVLPPPGRAFDSLATESFPSPYFLLFAFPPPPLPLFPRIALLTTARSPVFPSSCTRNQDVLPPGCRNQGNASTRLQPSLSPLLCAFPLPSSPSLSSRTALLMAARSPVVTRFLHKEPGRLAPKQRMA